MNTSLPASPQPQKTLLSVVVPLLNEEDVIRLTHARLAEVLSGQKDLDLEIVYVDDGSNDGSPALLSDIADSDPRVCVITLSRNFGHQPAVTAGLRHASGDIVAVIDADLQDPVELIPQMIGKWREGYTVVYGIRRNRKESIPTVLGYSFFYRLLALISQIEVPQDSGDFCLMDRKALDAINQLPEKNRFVRGLRAWYGGKQIGILYDRPARAAGSTRYSLGKMLNLGLDGILSFSVLPLRFIFWLGLGSSLVAVLGLVFFLLHRLIGFRIFGHTPADVPGFTSLIFAILLGSGVQLLSIGVLGEYLGRIYLEVKNRPEYVISRFRPSDYGQARTDTQSAVVD
jgi:glycosyltransferase involved in cell wall biosynthesis